MICIIYWKLMDFIYTSLLFIHSCICGDAWCVIYDLTTFTMIPIYIQALTTTNWISNVSWSCANYFSHLLVSFRRIFRAWVLTSKTIVVSFVTGSFAIDILHSIPIKQHQTKTESNKNAASRSNVIYTNKSLCVCVLCESDCFIKAKQCIKVYALRASLCFHSFQCLIRMFAHKSANARAHRTRNPFVFVLLAQCSTRLCVFIFTIIFCVCFCLFIRWFGNWRRKEDDDVLNRFCTQLIPSRSSNIISRSFSTLPCTLEENTYNFARKSIMRSMVYIQSSMVYI